jgi:recombination protein RecT
MNIADQKNPLVQLKTFLDQRQGELQSALPKHIPPERFTRVVLTAIQTNPELLACSRQSLWNACMRAAADGLLPDSRDGVIVAYKDVATWMPMIGGLLKRFRNSGQFKSVATNVVRQGEQFEYWIDEHGEHLKHVPADGEGEIIKAYAVAQTLDGGCMIRVMPVADIDKRRKASRAANSPMWQAWYEEAAQKTVLRNLCKRLPMSSDLDDLVRRDDALYDFDGKEKREPINWDALPKPQLGGEDDPAPADTQETMSAGADADPTNEAFEAGQRARREGIQRRAVPGEYRSADATALAKAWVSGWDAGDQP